MFFSSTFWASLTPEWSATRKELAGPTCVGRAGGAVRAVDAARFQGNVRDSWRETQLRGRERFGWSTWSAVVCLFVCLFGRRWPFRPYPPPCPTKPPTARPCMPTSTLPPAVLPASRPSAFAIPHLCVPLRPLPPAWRPSRPPPSPSAPALAGLGGISSSSRAKWEGSGRGPEPTQPPNGMGRPTRAGLLCLPRVQPFGS